MLTVIENFCFKIRTENKIPESKYLIPKLISSHLSSTSFFDIKSKTSLNQSFK